MALRSCTLLLALWQGPTLASRLSIAPDETLEEELQELFDTTDMGAYRPHPCLTAYVHALPAGTDDVLSERNKTEALATVHDIFLSMAGEFESQVCSGFDRINDEKFAEAVLVLWRWMWSLKKETAQESTVPLAYCAGRIADAITEGIAAVNEKSLMDVFCGGKEAATTRILAKKELLAAVVPKCGSITEEPDMQYLVGTVQELTCNFLEFGIMKTASPLPFIPIFTDLDDKDLAFERDVDSASDDEDDEDDVSEEDLA